MFLDYKLSHLSKNDVKQRHSFKSVILLFLKKEQSKIKVTGNQFNNITFNYIQNINNIFFLNIAKTKLNNLEF